jgi:hypothetical protein
MTRSEAIINARHEMIRRGAANAVAWEQTDNLGWTFDFEGSEAFETLSRNSELLKSMNVVWLTPEGNYVGESPASTKSQPWRTYARTNYPC